MNSSAEIIKDSKPLDKESARADRVEVRNERLYPQKTNRVYCNLSQLRDKLQQLIDSEALLGGETVLDYGCGDKPYRSLFEKKFRRYVGVDLETNKDADLFLKPNGELPVVDDSVDCVLSSQVLEHVPDPHAYLKESFRVLRPGGALLLSTHGIWPYHPHPNDFWRWTLEGLKRQITAAGFAVVTAKAVFGPESAALQLWQDATFERLPRFIRPLYTGFFQLVISFIESRQPDKVANDASIYIVMAHRPERGLKR